MTGKSPAAFDRGENSLEYVNDFHLKAKALTVLSVQQLPHKSVNFLIILVVIKGKLTDLCGN